MNRIIVALAALVAVNAGAQSGGTVPKVGYLGFLSEPAQRAPLRQAFLDGLIELGYRPGQSILVETRRYSSEAQLRKAIGELTKEGVRMLIVGPPATAAAARKLAPGTPIVCASCGDPVENGLAASLARPGGQVTGIASLSAELIGKRLGQLKTILPRARRVAVFIFPGNPGTPITLSALQKAEGVLGLEVLRVEIRGAEDIAPGFHLAAKGAASAVLVQDDPLLRSLSTQIGALSLKHRLPVSAGLPELAEAGALVAYGPDRQEMARRAAAFVDRILKGDRPEDLPFEQVAKLNLIVNVRTAKALEIVLPPSLLVQANRIIE